MAPTPTKERRTKKGRGTWKDTVVDANVKIAADGYVALFNTNRDGRRLYGIKESDRNAVGVAAGSSYLALAVKVGDDVSDRVRLKMTEAALSAAIDEGAKIAFEGDDGVLAALAVFWLCTFDYQEYLEAVENVKGMGFVIDEELSLWRSVKEYIVVCQT